MLTSNQGDGEREPQYTKLRATRLIKEISQKGSIRTSGHAKKQMKLRNISTQDILWAFKHGKVFDEPEPHIKSGNWLYKIIGSGIDNASLEVVVDINEQENYLNIITAF